MSKAQIIMQGGRLGIDYGLTVSCYQADAEGRACGVVLDALYERAAAASGMFKAKALAAAAALAGAVSFIAFLPSAPV